MRNENQNSIENKKRVYRQTALVMDRDRINDQAITFSRIREIEHMDWSGNGPVVRKEVEPKWIRVLSAIGGWILAAGVVVLAVVQIWNMLTEGYGPEDFPTGFVLGGAMLLAGMALYGGMRGIMAYRDRQRWLQVVRQQELEKQKKACEDAHEDTC